MNKILEFKARREIGESLISLFKNNRERFIEIYEQFLPDSDPIFSRMESVAEQFSDRLAFGRALVDGNVECWNPSIGFYTINGNGSIEYFRSIVDENSPVSLSALSQEILDSEDESTLESLDVDLYNCQDLDKEDVKHYLEFLLSEKPTALVAIHNHLNASDYKIFIGKDELMHQYILPMCDPYLYFDNSKAIESFVNIMLSSLGVSLDNNYYTVNTLGEIVGVDNLEFCIDFDDLASLASQIADNNLLYLLDDNIPNGQK